MDTPPSSKSSFKTQLQTFVRALRHRNFRLFYGGQSISLIGTWMQRVTQGWLVYQLTHSAFLLGVVSFAGQIPVLLLAPVAGVLADHWNRHRLLVLTQTLAMVQAFVLAALVLTNTIQIWHIVVLSVMLGVINAFDMPIRQSFMIEMIDDKSDLGNAIALNSSMVNGGRMIGPAVAGAAIALFGEGICFLLNGLSYIAVITSLLMMHIDRKEIERKAVNIWDNLKDGFSYVSGFEPIRAILLLLALASIMGMPYTTLMPAFAQEELGGGPDVYGLLMGATGLGALFGAIFLASRKTVLGYGKVLPMAATTFGVGLIAFAFSRLLALSIPLMAVVGFGQMLVMAGSNTLIQTIVDNDKRGRVMSLFAVALMGMMPIGSFLAGSLASKIGVQWTIAIGGAACVTGAAVFTKRLPKLREMVRPIYVRMGILPETMAVNSLQLQTSGNDGNAELDSR